MNLQEQFEEQMKTVKSIKIDGVNLKLMQQYTIFRFMTDDFFFNTSGTGGGKTIAALAVSKYFNMKMLVITNNSGKSSYFNDAKKINYDISNMMVINYDKFSFDTTIKEYSESAKNFNPDFVVLDEVHNVKVNEKSANSHRSKIIKQLLDSLSYKKLLIQTATPVVNDVSETESLFKIGMPNYNTEGFSSDARKVMAYKTLTNVSVCFPKKSMKGGSDFKPIKYSKKAGKDDFISKVKYDIYNFNNKFEALKPYIKKRTIIYTEYTEIIVDKLYEEVSNLGFSVGKYTGEEKDNDFCNYDVMIITSAGSTGTDGLQKCFNRMLFFTLPNTWAAFEQAIGRIDRENGSNFNEVELYYLIDDGSETTYSDQSSWNRIIKKKFNSDLIRDGKVSGIEQHKEKILELSNELT